MKAKNCLLVTKGTENGRIERHSHTLKKCRHFLPSVRVYTTHGSSTRRGSFCGGLFVAYCALLAQGDKWTQRLRPARPTRRVGMLRGDNRGGLGLCITLFRRREKRQFVFGTVTATCHSERSRGEGCKDRKERAIPRRSRSFAEGAKRMEQNRALLTGRRDMRRV